MQRRFYQRSKSVKKCYGQDTSGSWLVTGTPASATWDTANVKALVYYFDRKP